MTGTLCDKRTVLERPVGEAGRLAGALRGGNVAVAQSLAMAKTWIAPGKSGLERQAPGMRLNVIGLERRGFSPETIAALKQAYRLFFRSKLVAKEATARIRAELPGLPEIDRFVTFVSAQGRGITR